LPGETAGRQRDSETETPPSKKRKKLYIALNQPDWLSIGDQFCLPGLIVDVHPKVIANGHTALLVWYWIAEHDPSVVSFCEVEVNPRGFVSPKIVAGSNCLFRG
jgi:hypothetical protein